MDKIPFRLYPTFNRIEYSLRYWQQFECANVKQILAKTESEKELWGDVMNAFSDAISNFGFPKNKSVKGEA